MIFLSADACRSVLDTSSVLSAVEDALRMEGRDAIRWSIPSNLRVPGVRGEGRLRVKACALAEQGVVGVRILMFSRGSTDTRWLILFDEATGQPHAIVDETWTYAHRSIACVSLLASRMSAGEVRSVAILGAGRIGRAALPYVDRLFPHAEVAIASRREGSRSTLAEYARESYGMSASAESVETAVRAAQVVLACSGSTSPILRDPWVGPGTVVSSLEPRECDPALFATADLRVVDSREQLRDELAGAFGPEASGRIDATMAEVVSGEHPGRTAVDQRILLLSQGLVSQDVLLATRAFREAKARGIGVEIPLPAA